MAITYRTTDLAKWGVGKGADITATEFDNSLWDLQEQINAIPTDAFVGIDDITSPTPNQILITLTDATTRGPFTIEASAPPTRVELSATTRTLSLGDNWQFFDCTNASGCTVTVPPNADVAFAVDTTHIGFRQGDDNALTFAQGSGVTITAPDGRALSTGRRGAVAWLVKTATNTWRLYGDLARATQALATSGTISLDPALGDATITPSGDATINAASVMKDEWTLIVTTSGVTSRDITFGTNFKSQGVLSTGTVTAKQFIVRFVGDGSTYREISRTAAM